jgi:hypothetical protein
MFGEYLSFTLANFMGAKSHKKEVISKIDIPTM